MRSAIALPAAAAIPEKPITFTAFSIRQTLAGRKTQTRRLVNLERLRVRLPYEVKSDLPDLFRPVIAKPGTYPAYANLQGAMAVKLPGRRGGLGVKPGEFDFVCPYVTGTTRLVDGGWRIEPHGEQRLYVRETWTIEERGPMNLLFFAADTGSPCGIDVGAKGDRYRMPANKNRSPLFMPRWAARLVLKVHEVRLERLGDISDRDLDAEGMRVNDVARDLGVDWSSIPDQRAAFRLAWNKMHGAGAFEADPFVWAIAYSVVRAGASQ